MAKIFLDTNIYIDVLCKRTDRDLSDFEGHELYISPLSIHILTYVNKYAIPHDVVAVNTEVFNIVPFDGLVSQNALIGPTSDFEDNVQLHSATLADCDFFLTEDKKLLKMKFFGRMKVKTHCVL
jgi:hypothetical protein